MQKDTHISGFARVFRQIQPVDASRSIKMPIVDAYLCITALNHGGTDYWHMLQVDYCNDVLQDFMTLRIIQQFRNQAIDHETMVEPSILEDVIFLHRAILDTPWYHGQLLATALLDIPKALIRQSIQPSVNVGYIEFMELAAVGRIPGVVHYSPTTIQEIQQTVTPLILGHVVRNCKAGDPTVS